VTKTKKKGFKRIQNKQNEKGFINWARKFICTSSIHPKTFASCFTDFSKLLAKMFVVISMYTPNEVVEVRERY
jgi:hypothetical protein